MMDIVSIALVLWAVINIAVTLIPGNWLVDYEQLSVDPDTVCIGHTQTVSGDRTSVTHFKSSGVDKIINADNGNAVYRWSWESSYEKGTTTGSWRKEIDIPAGEYYWDAQVYIHFPLMLPKKLPELRSEVFTVEQCQN